MPKVPLRRLLSKLTALALSTTAMAPAAAVAAVDPVRDPPGIDADKADNDDSDFDAGATIDREQLDAYDAAAALGRGLALALGELRPLSATHLMATWALSDDALRRLAVAQALEWPFRLVGDDVMIDHLSRDPDPAIRTASARAAWTRRQTGGDQGVLARLGRDPDPRVRCVAISALSS